MAQKCSVKLRVVAPVVMFVALSCQAVFAGSISCDYAYRWGNWGQWGGAYSLGTDETLATIIAQCSPDSTFSSWVYNHTASPGQPPNDAYWDFTGYVPTQRLHYRGVLRVIDTTTMLEKTPPYYSDFLTVD